MNFSSVPPCSGDRRADSREVVRHDLAVDLGVELGGETRRVDEIAEEHGHVPAVRGSLRRAPSHFKECRVVTQNPLLQGAQLLARLEPELRP